jgi:glycosyltransferase involved in cell wall biosynthesis
MENQFFISVIVPVYNGGRFLHQCLDAIATSSYQSYELIVVDDGSTDDSAEVSKQKGALVLHTPHSQSGPAAARNYGSQQARGDVLFFVDADVVVRRETMSRVAAHFQNNPDLAALFGSYDDDPAEKNFLSQYKNLQHHFVHQQSCSDAVTFWAGCGAIRRNVFTALGGYDDRHYPKPSIEDIELGYRMRSAGHGILLDKELQVKHLKQWKLGSLLRADILYRAVPWSQLILQRQGMVNDLNLKTSDRVSAGLTGLALATLLLSLYKPQLLILVPFFLTTILFLNRRLYGFFFQKSGLLFTALTFLMQLLYYLYSGVTFVLCWCWHKFSSKRLELRRDHTQ